MARSYVAGDERGRPLLASIEAPWQMALQEGGRVRRGQAVSEYVDRS